MADRPGLPRPVEWAAPEHWQAIDFISDLHLSAALPRTFDTWAAYMQRTPADAVVILGFCAEYCVLSTCRGARDEGFTSMLLRDALASGHPERIPFVEAVNDGLTFGTLRYLLG